MVNVDLATRSKLRLDNFGLGLDIQALDLNRRVVGIDFSSLTMGSTVLWP